MVEPNAGLVSPGMTCFSVTTPELIMVLPAGTGRTNLELSLALLRAVLRTFCLPAGCELREGEAFAGLLQLAERAWLEQEPGARKPDPVIERDGYRCS